MSSELEPSLEYLKQIQQYTAESLMYVTPMDPYDDRLIQFITLKQLGYPVDIERFSPTELPENWRDDTHQAMDMDLYPLWIRPIASTDFGAFIDTPDVPGESFGEYGDEIADILYEHPVKLISDVDYGSPNIMAHYLGNYRETGELRLYSAKHPKHTEGLLNEGLLERCFMASFERFMQKLQKGYPVVLKYYIPTPETIMLYGELVQKGQRPVTPEELGGLSMDYYQLVEELVPDFKKFKMQPELETGLTT